MDKRTLLALVLTAIVIVVTPMVFPGSRPVRRPDSLAVGASAAARGASTGAAAGAPSASAPSAVHAAPVATAPTPTAATSTAAVPAETLTVRRGGVTYAFTTAGAAPISVHLDDSLYRNLRRDQQGRGVSIAEPGGKLLDLALVAGTDTIRLDTIPFHGVATADGATFTSTTSPAVTVSYSLGDKPYVVRMQGAVERGAPGTRLLVTLPRQLASAETDTADDISHFAFGYKPERADVESVPFSKLDTARAVVRVDTAAMRWVAMRNKFFMVAVISSDSTGDFRTLTMRGGEKVGRLTTAASAVAASSVASGPFAYELFIGPQSWPALHAAGYDLENANPYASFGKSVIQPFTTIIMRVLLWMKRTLQVNYGWVLVIFGVVIRLLLWPLNQNAMRSSLKMQRLQPELQEVQRKYKTDPEKQREALMKLYQEHGMSPFSPMMGCLPMLLPMPVLFALYYVFRSTIEFRGVSFLWLPDLTLRDPYYITPIVMGLSMFLLSWIGMRNMPPNPQSKVMAYMMPAMMTMMFLNFSSGLNLYYAVQNVAALPQQWLIARERAKSGPRVDGAPVGSAAGRTSGRRG